MTQKSEQTGDIMSSMQSPAVPGSQSSPVMQRPSPAAGAESQSRVDRARLARAPGRLGAVVVEDAVPAFAGTGDAAAVAGRGVAVVALLGAPAWTKPSPQTAVAQLLRAVVGVGVLPSSHCLGGLDDAVAAARRARPRAGRAAAVVAVVDADLADVR